MPDLEEKVFCSRHWNGDDNQDTYLLPFYKISIILLSILTITATLGNSLILAALHKGLPLHPPSKLLLRSLAITDLCVGVISQPLIIAYLLLTLAEHWSSCRVIQYTVIVVNTIFPGVSLFTLTAISVDRLLALLLRLRYRQVVTVKRVRVVIFIFWPTSSLVAIMFFWSPKLFFTVSGAVVLLSVLMSTYCYTRIFHTMQRQQTQVQDAIGGQNTGLNIARYKKTVFNSLWIHFTLIACYLPFTIATVVITSFRVREYHFLAEILTASLVYLNSSLNPILYCWKMKEVRQAVKGTVRQLCACFRPVENQ